MAQSQTMERFPDFMVQPQRHRSSSIKSLTSLGMGRPRRRSSNLAGDIPGDTGAPAISTLDTKTMLLSPPHSPRTASAPSRTSKRRKARSLLRRWRNFSFTHTWVNPLIVILVLLFCYALNPTPSNPLHQAIFLSHELPPNDPHIPLWARKQPNPPTYYGKGLDDLKFVAFYVIVLSFTREFCMQRIIRPLGQWAGITSRRKMCRFMEQMYTALYFSVFGPYGLYVMSRTPVWYFNTDGMYEDSPHRAHDALFKAYYLLEASYWAQQAIVLLLQLEAPRKDFKELVAHHILTLALIGLSYRFHFTYMGIAVYITHDISDFFLATLKSLHYVGSDLVAPFYAVFACAWIYMRHYINLKILYSILTSYTTIGTFELNWETQHYKSPLSQYITFTLLAALQCINLFWLFLILRIGYRTVAYSSIKDDRSDDEASDAEAESKSEEQHTAKRKVAWANANGVTRTQATMASGTDVSIPEGNENGHADFTYANGNARHAKKDESAKDR